MEKQITISSHELAEENEKEQIRKYFNYMKNGICVEVGSNEPLSVCSQSWHLEDKLNWKCVLIEPNPDLVAKTINVRPNALVHNCACVSDDKKGYMVFIFPCQIKEKALQDTPLWRKMLTSTIIRTTSQLILKLIH